VQNNNDCSVVTIPLTKLTLSVPDALPGKMGTRPFLDQWFLIFTNTANPYVVFQAFVKPHFCPL